jgi:hypothetical protein
VGDEPPDRYTYDPEAPTPTVGGSIVSYVITPGSVDVSEVQRRPDVLTYTTEPFERQLDLVGPVRLVLHAGSSAIGWSMRPAGRRSCSAAAGRDRFTSMRWKDFICAPGENQRMAGSGAVCISSKT